MDVFLFDPLFLSVHQLRCQKDIRKEEEEKEKKFFACYRWLLETNQVLSFWLHIQCEYEFDLCPEEKLTTVCAPSYATALTHFSEPAIRMISSTVNLRFKQGNLGLKSMVYNQEQFQIKSELYWRMYTDKDILDDSY